MHRLVCTGHSALSEEESDAGSGIGRWRERGCKCHGMKGASVRFGLGDLISLHLTNLIYRLDSPLAITNNLRHITAKAQERAILHLSSLPSPRSPGSSSRPSLRGSSSVLQNAKAFLPIVAKQSSQSITSPKDFIRSPTDRSIDPPTHPSSRPANHPFRS